MEQSTATTTELNGAEETSAEVVPTEEVEQSTGTDDASPVTEQSATEAEETSDGFTNINPNELPEELKPLYKQMQADYTRKTQGISGIRSKAEALDQLLENEKFVNLMDILSGNQQPTEAQLSGEELLQKIVENPQNLSHLIRSEAAELVRPLEDRYWQDQAQRELQALDKKYSPEKYGDRSFAAKRAEVQRIMEEKGIEPEDAYKLATWPDALQAGANQAAKIIADRNRSAVPAAKNTAVVEGATAFKTVREAFNAAAKENNYDVAV